MAIVSLPNPTPGPGEILVRTHFSAISTGTEGKTVSDARKGYLAKAQARKEEVAKVIKAAQTFGIADTYKMVMNKLEALQPLGYSLSGEVLEVGSGVTGFKVGDKVACGGATASHAELVVVPKNLCVKLPDTTPMDEAAYTTIGAIAMQGIRRADLKLGENCAVIGLGIIGQITLRLLKAAGVKAFGIDLKSQLIDLAKSSGVEACLRSDETLEEKVAIFSDGYGVDAVIITAATSSLDPIELAGALCRNNGKVVIVGSVPTGFNRKNYYRKELDLRMSTSYGPGRYNTHYEEKGLDYPIGQVRWTENRNMQAFAELLSSGAITLKNLISHRFAFENALDAFDLVVDKTADKMGVLLEYDLAKPLEHHPKKVSESSIVKGNRVSVIGAGSFASNFLLPQLKDELTLSGIVTSRPHTAENALRKFGFENAYANVNQMFETDGAAACVIATTHDSHAPIAIQALKAGKRVFLEKPLCLNMDEYFEIKKVLESSNSPDLMVGFNRRFAPHTMAIKEKITGIPMAINYRINAGSLPPDHWVHDLEIGGGRIVGEVCHFIDLCCFLAESKIHSVSAVAMKSPQNHDDTIVASLFFENNSVASISYFSNGSKKLPKEYLEVFGGGLTAVIDDFKTLKIMGEKITTSKLSKQDKGHNNEVSAFAEAIKTGKPFPISVADVLHTTLSTFAMVESIKNTGEKIIISEFELQWISQKVN